MLCFVWREACDWGDGDLRGLGQGVFLGGVRVWAWGHARKLAFFACYGRLLGNITSPDDLTLGQQGPAMMRRRCACDTLPRCGSLIERKECQPYLRRLARV